MTPKHKLGGVIAASVTPLNSDGSLRLDDLVRYLEFLAKRGCHGSLILGTTGEGPSFSIHERLEVMRVAVQITNSQPDFHLLAGTGTPSLDETINLTKKAFDLGYTGVIVLPPYYFRKVTDEGLYRWYGQVIEKAVPGDGALFGYHIPPTTGVPLSFDLLRRLKDAYGSRFAGIKDSSGDPDHAHQLGERFGDELLVYSGNDKLFQLALQNSAFGCITLLSNLRSEDLRRVWEAHLQGKFDSDAQKRLEAARAVLDAYPPAAPTLKLLLHELYGFPRWAVRLPLLVVPDDMEMLVLEEVRRNNEAFSD